MSKYLPDSWQYLAEQVSQECDPAKLIVLVTELNRVLGTVWGVAMTNYEGARSTSAPL
jgi:hypothetical protein